MLSEEDIIINKFAQDKLPFDDVMHMEPYQKLRLLVKVFNGQIFYHRIGTGDTWRVMILF